MGTLQYSLARPALAQSNLTAIAPYMFWLMFRNVASDGFVFEDPVNTGVLSQPGCVLAAPSWENTATHVSQDYVYNWTRDAAIATIELAAGPLPPNQPLIDYVQFAQACQNSASAIGHFDRASFLINGTPRDWTDQTDGPALQTLAILQLFSQLDAPTQAVASALIAANRQLQRRNRRRTAHLRAHDRASRQRDPGQTRVAQPRRSSRLRRLDRNSPAAGGRGITRRHPGRPSQPPAPALPARCPHAQPSRRPPAAAAASKAIWAGRGWHGCGLQALDPLHKRQAR